MRKPHQRFQFKATVLAAALAVLPLATQAAGLGRITVLSALGQPLRAELEVTATSDESRSLEAKVAASEAFSQAGIEYSPALATLRFSKDIKTRGGRSYLEISTDRPLNEPFIDMLVELSWASGRLIREYTFLLDPPDFAQRSAPVPVAAPEVKYAPEMVRPSAPAPSVTADGVQSRPVVKAPAPANMQPAEKALSRSASGRTRTVVAGDTLGKIAAQTMPAGVSLDQMLVALFRNNREVFDGGNMNRVQAGKILAIPDDEAVRNVLPAEARREIVVQAVDFNAYRKRLAASAVAEPTQSAKQAVSGRITPRVDENAPLASGKDKLEVSRTETVKDANGKPLQGRIAALEEDLVARDRALKEAGSRIAALEKNLNDLQKLAELKSEVGADLQKQAEVTKPAAVEQSKVPPVSKEEPAKPQEVAKTEEVPKAAPAPAKPKKKPAPPPPPPPPEPDFVEENAPLVFGGGALLAVLFGWLGFSAYRKKRATAAGDSAPIEESELSAHSVFSSTSIAPPPGEQEDSQFSSTGVGMAVQQEAVDPIVEADTFLAFGRDAQAEEILLDALKTDPQRLAIHLKLLDIYAARKNASQFESVAKELHWLTGGTGADWEKAALLGSALDPENSLYSSTPPVETAETPIAEVDMDATVILRAAPEIEERSSEVAEVAEPESVGLDFDLDIGTADTASDAPSSPQVDLDSAGLDFDLDLGEPEASSADDIATNNEAAGLDIDFDMTSGDDAAPAPAPAPAPVPAPEATFTAPEPGAGDLEIPEAASDSSTIDFDFDLGTPDSTAPAPASDLSLDLPDAVQSSEPEMTPLDLGGISLELDTPSAGSAAENSVEQVAVPEPEAEVADVPDNPEVATKIELAMAYEEMGDHDGARELFEEALAEGSPAQQKVARDKLDGIS